MDNYLRLSARFDDEDGSLELRLSFEAKPFSGEGAAHFSKLDLDAFAAKLEAFPMRAAALIEGGYYEPHSASLRETHVRMQVQPADRGLLWLGVEVGKPLEKASSPGMRSTASHQFLIGYETVAKLSRCIRMLSAREREEVLLEIPAGI